MKRRSTSSKRGAPARPEGTGVLLVADNLQVGGVSRVVLDLARRLTEMQHTVAIAAGPEGGLWHLVPEGCAAHTLRSKGGIRALLHRVAQLRVLARSGAYDVIHAHQRGLALSARIAAIGTGLPVVEHVHNVFPPRLLERHASFRGDLLIACGTAVAAMLVRDFGRRPAQVITILNGIEDKHPANVRSASHPKREKVHLIGVGRLVEQKDPLRFVRVIAALAEIMPPRSISVTWYGDGPLRSEVQTLVEDLDLTEFICFPGNVEELAPKYADADILLLTSRWEGLPLVALEALAAGCAIVLPDVGSCADAYGDEPVGILYPADIDDADLAVLLAAELKRDRLEQLSANARLRYVSSFTLDRMFASVLEVYSIARHPKSPPNGV